MVVVVVVVSASVVVVHDYGDFPILICTLTGTLQRDCAGLHALLA